MLRRRSGAIIDELAPDLLKQPWAVQHASGYSHTIDAPMLWSRRVLDHRNTRELRIIGLMTAPTG
jgi:hypothetical protein